MASSERLASPRSIPALTLAAASLIVSSLLAASSCRESGSSGAPNADRAPGSPSAHALPAERRVVAVGGGVTEIVFALGLGAHVVAVDTSSIYPEDAVRPLPKIGYQRKLAAEGILAQRPTLVLLSSDAGPPPAVEQLRASGVPLFIAPEGSTPEIAGERIRRVADALDAHDRGEALAQKLASEVEAARALVRRAARKPKVLFIYARGAGAVMVSGAATPADAMIQLAGGENAVTGFEGQKPLTAESATAAAPDVILVPAHGLASVGGVEGLLAQPGLALTPAGRDRRVVAMDDVLLLAFGPRLGLAIRELALALHPELSREAP